MVLKKRYYGLTQNQKELFIHKRCYEELLQYLKDRGYDESHINRVDINAPVGVQATYVVKSMYQLFDYQIPIVNELSDLGRPSSRLDLQTGKGKTLSALSAVARLGKKCVVMVYPKYFGIWEKALKETFEGYEDGCGKWRVVSGSGDLQKLIYDGLEGKATEDIFIISNVTYRTYIEAFEQFNGEITEHGFAVPPQRFHEVIGAEVQINDEYQDDPALAFRIDMYTNVAKQIYLSATPYTGDPYVTRMIGVMLPPDTLCTLPTWDKYIDVVALLYSDPSVTSKDYLTPYKNTYNHNRYEGQMMRKEPRHRRRMDNYLLMVKKIIQGVYVRGREPGQKLLILCAKVEFIQMLTKWLKQQFPDLQIGEFVSGSDFRTLQTNDVTVSTIKSAGTGQDIINLKVVLLLQATGSEKDNVQIMGRLRKLKNWADVVPLLVYLCCTNIPHHLRYHHSKVSYFEGKAKSHRVMRL